MQTLILTPDDLTIEGMGVPGDELGLRHFNIDDEVLKAHRIIMFVDATDIDNVIEIYLKT
jgi:hypothetical protein